MVMFAEMRKLRMDVKREIRALRTEIKEVGPRVNQGMEPAILAAKRKLDREAGINGGDSWAKTAKKRYLQDPGTFENELKGISLLETENMEKEFFAKADQVESSFFWARASRAATFSIFTFISAFSSAEGIYAVAIQKAAPFQQSITLAVSACMAIATGAFLWIGKDSIEGAYRSALKEVNATREWMERKASGASETIAGKIESHKEWWIGIFSGKRGRLLH